MKKKFIFLLVMLFCLSGCTVKYKLDIDKDGKITEEASAMQDSTFFEEYENSSIGRVISFLIEPYSDKLNSNNYTTESIIANKSGGAKISKEYKNAEEYANNTILVSQFSNKISYSLKGSNVTLSAKGKISGETQNQEIIPIDSADIVITLPFKVIDSNADEVSDNKYTWHLSADNEKEIKITYDKDKIAKDINYPMIILVVVIIIAVVIAGFYVYNIKNKSNEVNKI